MKSFLEYVAEDILMKHGNNLSDIAIVFPNKRASLFLNQHLARLAGKPIWSPHYITISELFRSQSELTVADPIMSICMLYRAYTEYIDTEQSIDHFWSWGQIMLADFDDMDKNMGVPERVFKNIQDLHELDSVDYLTEDQRRLLKQFFQNFHDDIDTELKRKFLNLWCHLESIYRSFNHLMKSEGLAYEGALYREVAEKEELNLKHKKYIFIGFNVLQQVEQTLFKRLKREGKAEFYWDFDEYYMKNEGNEAGKYIREYLSMFPNELDSHNKEIYCNIDSKKDVSYLSASTEDIQARYITDWLREGNRLAKGERTAIVLADESLLKTAIHCLPKEVEQVNITIGYPLNQSPVASLVKAFIQLHNNPVNSNSDTYPVQFVMNILRHPYAHFISDKVMDLQESIREDRYFFLKPEQLYADEALEMIFRPIDDENGDRLMGIIGRLAEVLEMTGMKSKDMGDAFLQESVFRMYTIANRLRALVESGVLNVELSTLTKLLDQITQSTTMPFHGEPAVGLQIMGVLETRNLDFDHVLVLSCGEGNLPKGVNDTSLIPHSIRKAYGLTTVENKIAIYAYYFYRLIQRANDITLTYNNSTEDGHTGQMSRFMVQLMVEAEELEIKHKSLIVRQEPKHRQIVPIKKDEEVMKLMAGIKHMSASAINKYLRCPLSFYYNKVRGLQQLDDDELLDNRIFGTVFHKAAENMYENIKSADGLVTKEVIALLLNEGKKQEKHLRYKHLYDFVDEAFRTDFFHITDPTRKIEYNGLQLINREVIVKYLIRLLKADQLLAPFTIIGLEESLRNKYIDYEVNGEKRSMPIVGFIDRLDKIIDPETGCERIRVVDYKTGRNKPGKMGSIEQIFDPASIKEHSDYYQQTFLYSILLHNDRKVNPTNIAVSPALLYIQHSENDGNDIELKLNGEKVTDIAVYKDEIIEQEQMLMSEIFNPEIDFTPTPHRERCMNCEFFNMCRR